MQHQHTKTLFLNLENATDAINQLTDAEDEVGYISVLTLDNEGQYFYPHFEDDDSTNFGTLVDTGVLVFPKISH